LFAIGTTTQPSFLPLSLSLSLYFPLTPSPSLKKLKSAYLNKEARTGGYCMHRKSSYNAT